MTACSINAHWWGCHTLGQIGCVLWVEQAAIQLELQTVRSSSMQMYYMYGFIAQDGVRHIVSCIRPLGLPLAVPIILRLVDCLQRLQVTLCSVLTTCSTGVLHVSPLSGVYSCPTERILHAVSDK